MLENCPKCGHRFVNMDQEYSLYLEGLANEIIHILQRCRRSINAEVMNFVEVGLVQNKPNSLTSAIYRFSDKIVERVRIVNFSPNPLPKVVPSEQSFKDSFGNTFDFEIHIKIHKNTGEDK